jgi:hypothetical protein
MSESVFGRIVIAEAVDSPTVLLPGVTRPTAVFGILGSAWSVEGE